jgi:hypothetical protein
MQIRPVGAELFHADRQTDRQRRTAMKLTVAFRNFGIAPKKMHVENPTSLEPPSLKLLTFKWIHRNPGSSA